KRLWTMERWLSIVSTKPWSDGEKGALPVPSHTSWRPMPCGESSSVRPCWLLVEARGRVREQLSQVRVLAAQREAGLLCHVCKSARRLHRGCGGLENVGNIGQTRQGSSCHLWLVR